MLFATLESAPRVPMLRIGEERTRERVDEPVTVPPNEPSKPAQKRLTRRAFLRRLSLGGAGVVATGSATGAYAHYIEPWRPCVERVDLDLPDLPTALVGLKILQLSDLHHSKSVPAEYLRAQMDVCNKLAPDLVVMTGDYITAGKLAWATSVADIVGLLRPRLGKLAVLGNHDYGVFSPTRRPRGPTIGDQMQHALAAADVRVLRNQSVVLSINGARLQIIGVDDLWSGLCNPDVAFAAADPALPTIALAHNPDTSALLTEHRVDWLLCGHTHGGQVRLPFFGAPILPVKNRNLDQGRVQLGKTTVYINRGLGSLLQLRFNCPPEITLFTLARRA